MTTDRRIDVRIPLSRPFGSLTTRSATIVSGRHGWGESSPLARHADDRAACDQAAVETAETVAPSPVRESVIVNGLVYDDSPISAGHTAARLVGEGFTTLKVKVGDEHDVDRVSAVRSAIGDDIRLRVDANGAWEVDEARERLEQLAPLGLEFCEEPVAGLTAMAALRSMTEVPIAADESVRTIADVELLRALGSADILVLKVQRCGGWKNAMRWADMAGVPVVVSSLLETSVGLWAGVALAAALPSLPYASGLGTASLLVGDLVVQPLTPVRGQLGIARPEVDLDLVERYRVSA